MVLWLVAGVVLVPAAGADVIIDDFSAGETTLTASAATTEFRLTQTGLPGSNVIGGIRHMQIYANSLPAEMRVQGGQVDLVSKIYGGGKFTLKYNGATGIGGTPVLNLDLSGMEQFEITFSYLDGPMGAEVWVRSGHRTKMAYRTVRNPGVVEILLNGSDFAGINWADVDSIWLSLSSNRAYVSDSQTEIITDFRVTPEPASLLLLCVGGLGVLRHRRR